MLQTKYGLAEPFLLLEDLPSRQESFGLLRLSKTSFGLPRLTRLETSSLCRPMSGDTRNLARGHLLGSRIQSPTGLDGSRRVKPCDRRGRVPVPSGTPLALVLWPGQDRQATCTPSYLPQDQMENDPQNRLSEPSPPLATRKIVGRQLKKPKR